MQITRLGTDDSFEVLSPEQAQEMADAESDAHYEREKKIENLIRQTFARCELGIDEDRNYAVIYDEQDDRSARVVLDDFQISLPRLCCLLQSGLGNNYIVSASATPGEVGLHVEFNVDPSLDRSL